MHALELTANNRAMLRSVLNATGLSTSVHVHDYAASNESRVMRHVPTFAGGETRGLRASTDRLCRTSNACSERIDAITLDEFVERQGLSDLHHVTIDTEGHDALVLEGFRRTLSRRRVQLVEFEVNAQGFWTLKKRDELYRERRSLKGAASWLASAGYSCFWQTREGLVPLSGPCWKHEFDTFRHWSNVVCAHDAAVISQFVRLAKRDFARRHQGT